MITLEGARYINNIISKIDRFWSWGQRRQLPSCSNYIKLDLLTVFIYVPPDIEENEDLAVSSGESGSGSGEILPENDKEMHKILDLQTSIPYKKRKTKPAT